MILDVSESLWISQSLRPCYGMLRPLVAQKLRNYTGTCGSKAQVKTRNCGACTLLVPCGPKLHLLRPFIPLRDHRHLGTWPICLAGAPAAGQIRVGPLCISGNAEMWRCQCILSAPYTFCMSFLHMLHVRCVFLNMILPSEALNDDRSWQIKDISVAGVLDQGFDCFPSFNPYL